MLLKFAPINLPIKRRIQTLSAAVWIYTLVFGGLISFSITLYLILYTRLWWLTLIYVVWAYFDRHTPETGGRRIDSVRESEWWGYFRNYFPIRLYRLPWLKFPTDKNYLFCCFPHGLLTGGAFSVFATEHGEFRDYFPGLKPHLCVLDQHFNNPFLRELYLALGMCSPSARSLNYLLSKPGGGNAVALVVGGVAEAYYCKPRQYKLVLKNRKGFIKIALKNGSSLVPLFSFGETDIFDQYTSNSPWFKQVQESIRKVIGLAPIIPLGRGFFQYSFGIIPQRRSIAVVVGAPIHVEKVENPTQSQIDDLHKIFVDALINLFETQKHTYIKEADDIHIELL
ncbi:hypothetical protein HHI36_013304 [Cryptolaemus montrouzieri]|uniref:Acyltransferase n=1 Tax=Cryptolaemus montrouzieri TaxID=559131 RepID=A0ABD2NHF8_9CUCU